MTVFIHTFKVFKVQKQSPGGTRKKNVLKNFAKFTWRHLHWSLSFNKVAGWRAATLLETDSSTGIFMWILKIFGNTFFVDHLRTAASKSNLEYAIFIYGTSIFRTLFILTMICKNKILAKLKQPFLVLTYLSWNSDFLN